MFNVGVRLGSDSGSPPYHPQMGGFSLSPGIDLLASYLTYGSIKSWNVWAKLGEIYGLPGLRYLTGSETSRETKR